MRSTLWLLLLGAAILAAVVGCNNDSTAPPATQSYHGLIEGEIGDAAFEIVIQGSGNAEGPFALRGSNLAYVDSLGALVVDLTVTNQGDGTHAEPIMLTFVNLIPEHVTLLNPDNGINGDGAAIEFEFANADGNWTPGESSLPKTLQFSVAEGISIGFAARLDIGEVTNGGTISGRVWNDVDEDGVMDPDEGGVEGVTIALNSAGDDSVLTAEETETDEDGNYAFEGLRSGVYAVSTDSDLEATTPSQLTVLLVEVDGEVSDFTEANFGVLAGDDGDDDDEIDIGAFVEVNGNYHTDPDRLVAKGVEVSLCDGDDDDDDEHNVIIPADGGHDGDDHDVDCSQGKLRGPVTEVDADNFAFAVMGTWVTADESSFPEGLEVGHRVDVRLHVGDEDQLIVDRVKPWHNRMFEQVHGRVDDLEVVDDELHLTVLGTLVVLSRDHDDDDDDDDDDDHGDD